MASIRAIVRNEIVFLEQDMKSYDDLEVISAVCREMVFLHCFSAATVGTGGQ